MEALRAAAQRQRGAVEGAWEGGVANQMYASHHLSHHSASPPAPAPLLSAHRRLSSCTPVNAAEWGGGGAGAAAYTEHVGGAPLRGAGWVHNDAVFDTGAQFASSACLPEGAQHQRRDGGLYAPLGVGGGKMHHSAALYALPRGMVAHSAETSATQLRHLVAAGAASAAGVPAQAVYSAVARHAAMSHAAAAAAPHEAHAPHGVLSQPWLAGWMPIPAAWQPGAIAPGVASQRVGGSFEHSAAAAAMMPPVHPAVLLHAQAVVAAAAAAAAKHACERERLERGQALRGASGVVKSRFAGVSWHVPTQSWQAMIHFAGKQVALGRHDTEVAAARAWDSFAIAHGMQRRLNLPRELEAPALPAVVKRRSRFTGVSWYKAGSKWEAYIRFQGKQKSLGYFFDEHEAARAYDTFAIENSVNRPLNFPDAPSAARHTYEPSKKRARAKAAAAAAAAAAAEEKSIASLSAAPAVATPEDATAEADAPATAAWQRQHHTMTYVPKLKRWTTPGGTLYAHPERALREHDVYARETGIDSPLNFDGTVAAAATAPSAKRRKTAAACATLAAPAIEEACVRGPAESTPPAVSCL